MSNLKRIVKRDGRTVIFDPEFVYKAIYKSMEEVGEINPPIATLIADNIEKEITGITTVEAVQDLVEKNLMNKGATAAAKAYILYREKRNKARNSHSNSVIADIIAAKSTEVTRENANMNTDTPAGMMMKVASERTKDFVDEFLLSDNAREATKNNIIHIHDKDYYPSKSFTCLQHPIDKILHNGFASGHGESRPAKRIETSSMLGCISMESIQNEMHK